MRCYTYTKKKIRPILFNIEKLRDRPHCRDLKNDLMFKEYMQCPWVEQAVVRELLPWSCSDLIIDRLPLEFRSAVMDNLFGSEKKVPKTMRMDVLLHARSKREPQKNAWINLEMQPKLLAESLDKLYNYVCAMELSMLKRGGPHSEGIKGIAAMFVNQDLQSHKDRPTGGLYGNHYMSTQHNFWNAGASLSMIELPNHKIAPEEITSDFDGIMHIIGICP